jgi:dTDP-4-dehydrorhamnose reductase
MILVFGKTGQLATALARDPETLCLGRDVANLNDPAACAQIIADTDATAIINAAAYTAVDAAETDPDTAQTVNADAPAAMALAAAKRGIPFVHVSTDYVFDGTGATPWRETDLPAPATVYGQTKLAGEDAIRQANGAHAILRTAWVFSATGNNFLKTMLRLADTHPALRVVGDQHGGPTHAHDLATACLTVARALNKTNSGTYHYAGAPVTTWADFATAIFAQAGKTTTVTHIPTTDYPTPAPRPLNSALDCTLIQTTFGIDQPDWRAAITRTLKELTT